MSGEKDDRKKDEVFQYLIASTSLISWLFYFLFYSHLYTIEEIKSGITFISLAAPFYALCTFIYYKRLYKAEIDTKIKKIS
ncbi:hypothetical protein [Halobacillus massiliensis]|uniref:hypothetical protein n=1 Tax=Halobacillus massiliensis TaxID=1926286 RepID=UPI00117B2005|nr:hypothetical protein [Halobacillus massiliensis]